MWQNKLTAGPNLAQTQTPERRLETALTTIRRSIGEILTMRAAAVRHEVDKQSVSSGLSWLFGSFSNPFRPSDASTTEARQQTTAQVEDGFMRAESIYGGKLLERDPNVRLEDQSHFLYVNEVGDVVWVRREPGKEALVTRFQFGTEEEPGIMKIQSHQDPDGQESPSSVLRTMPRLSELEHMAGYLSALKTDVADLYGKSLPISDTQQLAA